MRLQAYNDNGTMKFRQVSGSEALDSLPVGTTTGYQGGVIPNGYLLCDGSTFDTAKYPELFTLLGTDTLPELFDHNVRDTAYTNIRSSVGSTVQTAYEMPYDGDITFTGTGYNQTQCALYVLKADGTTSDWSGIFAGGYDSASASGSGGTALFLNKGDKFYATNDNSNRNVIIQARFYKQHLLIKAATIGIADVSMNTVKTALSYSTDETLTGGTWIDGKPIYRKVIPAFRNGSWTSNWSTTQANYYYNPTDIPTDIDTLVNARAQSLRTDGWYDSMTQVENRGLTINVNTQTMWAIWPTTVSKADVILEYTKQ